MIGSMVLTSVILFRTEKNVMPGKEDQAVHFLLAAVHVGTT